MNLLHWNTTRTKFLLGHFRRYDFGLAGNMKKYGTFLPPAYNIDNIVCPVALYYSSNDWLAAVAVSIVDFQERIFFELQSLSYEEA